MPELPFAALLGGEPSNLHTLLDYGYRAVWKVEVAGKTFVVKKDERPGVAAGEVAALAHAAAHSIPVPEVAGFMHELAPLLALRWVEGLPLTEHSTPAILRDAGRVLRRIHDAPVLQKRLEPLDEWVGSWFDGELSWLVDNGVLSKRERDAALAHFESLRPLLRDTPLAWLHGDCQAAHFLADPKTDRVIAVIDWADAQHGPPEIDFAVLTLFDDAALPDLLNGYEASPDLRERLRLTLPLYQAVRAAGAHRWLKTHRYQDQPWALAKLRALTGSA